MLILTKPVLLGGHKLGIQFYSARAVVLIGLDYAVQRVADCLQNVHLLGTLVKSKELEMPSRKFISVVVMVEVSAGKYMKSIKAGDLFKNLNRLCNQMQKTASRSDHLPRGHSLHFIVSHNVL